MARTTTAYIGQRTGLGRSDSIMIRPQKGRSPDAPGSFLHCNAGSGQRISPQASPSRLDAFGQEKFKIESTPSFIIDGKTYAGDQSADKFAELIDPLLPQ